MRKLLLKVKEQASARIISCFFVLVLFAVGVAFGALAVKALSFSQKQGLLGFLQQIFTTDLAQLGNTGASIGVTVRTNLQLLWLPWLLGVTIFGLPMIILLVFFRGFILGFSVAFLLSELAWKGAMLALCSVVPHNLFSLPATLAVAALAIHHALTVWRPTRSTKRQTYWQQVGDFTLATVVCSGIVVLASLVEVFVTPVCVQFASRLFQ